MGVSLLPPRRQHGSHLFHSHWIVVYKACTFKGFLAMTKEATSTVGSIMVMIVCCLMLSRVFTVYRVPELV